MKIAVANDFFSPDVAGGADLFLRELCTWLRQEGFDVTIITSPFVGETGFKTHRIESSPFAFRHMRQIPGLTVPWNLFNSSLRKKMEKTYREEGTRLLYANNSYHLSFSPIQAAQRLGIPIVLDVHDYWPVCFSKDLFRDDEKFCEKGEGWWCSLCLSKKTSVPMFPLAIPGLYLEKALKKRVLGNVDKLVCHSDFVKKQLKRFGYESDVIPYPFFGRAGKKEKTGKKIVFMGRLTKAKGADLILPLARRLKEGGEDFEIDVIGTGPLMKILDRKDLNVNVHGFMGEERFEILKKASVLFAPSRWPEPFGIVALEAIGSGVPVVTLEGSGGLRELVEREGAGVVCKEEELPETVVRLLSSSSSPNVNMEKYGKERVFRAYRKIFEMVGLK